MFTLLNPRKIIPQIEWEFITFSIPITLITSENTDKSNLEKDKSGLQLIKLWKILFLMVSFLKLPFKFRQVIYFTSQVFFLFLWGKSMDWLGGFALFPVWHIQTSHNSILLWTSTHRASVLSLCMVLCTRRLRSPPCIGQGSSTQGQCRAVNLPMFLEVTVEAAAQGGHEVLAQIPILPPASTMIRKFAFFLNSTTRSYSLRKVLRTTSVSQKPRKKRLIYKFPQMLAQYIYHDFC